MKPDLSLSLERLCTWSIVKKPAGSLLSDEELDGGSWELAILTVDIHHTVDKWRQHTNGSDVINIALSRNNDQLSINSTTAISTKIS